MKIVRLESTNIKKLRAVTIEPTGNVVRVTGRNGQGKSSALDSIQYAFGGGDAIAAQPIRRGEERADIRIDLGELVVHRTFSASGSRVTVTSADGARYPSPQAMLDAMYGKVAFDPVEFSRQAPKQQLDTLRQLVPLDVDVDQLDRLNAHDFAERTNWNREVKRLAERVATLSEGIDPGMDVTPLDVAALLRQMAEASEQNAAIERERSDRGRERERLAAMGAKRTFFVEEINRLQRELAALDEMITARSATFQSLPPLAEPIDVSSLHEQINEATKDNSRREQQQRQRAAHQAVVNELSGAKAMSEALTEAMEDRARQKAEAIAAAKMPVPGLSFGDGTVLYNGFPLDQASSAEQLRVSFAMAIALNPKLRVALIRGGSLLDAESMAIISEMADAHDFQVWIEVVGDGSDVGIVIEDGSVVSVDGVAVTHDAPDAHDAEHDTPEPQTASAAD
jgi:hypothetical protein